MQYGYYHSIVCIMVDVTALLGNLKTQVAIIIFSLVFH